jgi:hypothetical protein
MGQLIPTMMKKIKWLLMALALSLFCFPLWAQTEQPDHSEEPADMYETTPEIAQEAVPYVPQLIEGENGEWVDLNAPPPKPEQVFVDETDHSEEPAELYENEPVNPASRQRPVPNLIEDERGEWIDLNAPEPKATEAFIDHTDHSEEPAELYQFDPPLRGNAVEETDLQPEVPVRGEVEQPSIHK